jgi:hypothetical protein
MKKLFIYSVIIVFSVACTRSSMPTDKETAKVIESYFRLIANSDTEGLQKFSTDEALEIGQFFIASLDDSDKSKLKNYKVEIVSIEKKDDDLFVCSYKDNTGGDLLTCSLTREKNKLKITGDKQATNSKKPPVLSDWWGKNYFRPIDE